MFRNRNRASNAISRHTTLYWIFRRKNHFKLFLYFHMIFISIQGCNVYGVLYAAVGIEFRIANVLCYSFQIFGKTCFSFSIYVEAMRQWKQSDWLADFEWNQNILKFIACELLNLYIRLLYCFLFRLKYLSETIPPMQAATKQNAFSLHSYAAIYI